MMNRGVMDRQMFRNGGAAFPDLSGDGNVTQRDILMGRGVIPMQEGGNPALEAGVNAATEAFIMTVGRAPRDMEELLRFSQGAQGYNPSGLSPDNLPSQSDIVPIDPSYLGPMAGETVYGPRPPVQEEGAGLLGGFAPGPSQELQPPINPQDYFQRPQQNYYPPRGDMEMDRRNLEPVIRRQEGGPAMVMPSDMASMAQQMIASEAQDYGDPETAENYEEMMNMVRGDQATVEERRSELASLVGEQDAMQTPESVLALVQPIVQLSMVEEAMAPGDNVDAGVGALAAQQMTTPIQGDMAGGVMTLAGGPEPQMQGMA
jgi:hypothetical protein